jgi:hypothetical protein
LCGTRHRGPMPTGPAFRRVGAGTLPSGIPGPDGRLPLGPDRRRHLPRAVSSRLSCAPERGVPVGRAGMVPSDGPAPRCSGRGGSFLPRAQHGGPTNSPLFAVNSRRPGSWGGGDPRSRARWTRRKRFRRRANPPGHMARCVGGCPPGHEPPSEPSRTPRRYARACSGVHPRRTLAPPEMGPASVERASVRRWAGLGASSLTSLRGGGLQSRRRSLHGRARSATGDPDPENSLGRGGWSRDPSRPPGRLQYPGLREPLANGIRVHERAGRFQPLLDSGPSLLLPLEPRGPADRWSRRGLGYGFSCIRPTTGV